MVCDRRAFLLLLAKHPKRWCECAGAWCPLGRAEFVRVQGNVLRRQTLAFGFSSAAVTAYVMDFAAVIAPSGLLTNVLRSAGR